MEAVECMPSQYPLCPEGVGASLRMEGVGAMYLIEMWLLPCFASSVAKFRK